MHHKSHDFPHNWVLISKKWFHPDRFLCLLWCCATKMKLDHTGAIGLEIIAIYQHTAHPDEIFRSQREAFTGSGGQVMRFNKSVGNLSLITSHPLARNVNLMDFLEKHVLAPCFSVWITALMGFSWDGHYGFLPQGEMSSGVLQNNIPAVVM